MGHSRHALPSLLAAMLLAAPALSAATQEPLPPRIVFAQDWARELITRGAPAR